MLRSSCSRPVRSSFQHWACVFLFFGLASFLSAEENRLEYSPAPPDNPLKGFVPYLSSAARERFPHSMEFCYLSLRELMLGYESFDWGPLEEKLNLARERGCQLTFRVVLEYPGKPTGLPQFLVDEGVELIRWEPEDSSQGGSFTPDYEDPRVRRALEQFLAAFGEKYDGDPRIGFLTAGLLGSWGEWHTYPRSDLWASEETQRVVLDGYEKAFKKTPVLLRYPAKEGHYNQAANVDRSFGYHDDSFDWATLDTGREEDSWFFVPLLKDAGAVDKWKRFPIAGEVRPELWKSSFTDDPHPRAQGFARCVEATHVTWLLDTGLFSHEIPLPPERKQRAIRAAQSMGYEFHVAGWRKEEGAIQIRVENRGVAPFYHDWPVELFLGERRIATFDLRGLLPGEERLWKTAVDATGQFRIRVPNPMKSGKPLRFANKEQDGEWLVLP